MFKSCLMFLILGSFLGGLLACSNSPDDLNPTPPTGAAPTSSGESSTQNNDNKKVETVEALKLINLNPIPDAQGINPDQSLLFVFNKEMNKSSVCQSVQLLDVQGKVVPLLCETADDKLFVFRLQARLFEGARYQVIIQKDVESKEGKKLDQGVSYSFSTRPDTVAPKLVSVFPSGQNPGNASIRQMIKLEFDDLMDQVEAGFVLREVNGGKVVKDLKWTKINDKTYQIEPNLDLMFDTHYEFLVTQSVKDKAGNVFSPEYRGDFTVVSKQKYEASLRPKVRITSPKANEKNVRLDPVNTISIWFDSPMNEASVIQHVEVRDGAGKQVKIKDHPNSGWMSYFFDFVDPVKYGETYTVRILKGAYGINGQDLDGDEYKWDFSVQAPPWTLQFGSKDDEELTAAILSRDGKSLYATGWTKGELEKGKKSLAEDYFLAKVELATGKLEWLKQHSLNQNPRDAEIATCLAEDSRGNVYVAGYIQTISSTIFNDDLFVQRFDRQGNPDPAWKKQMGAFMTSGLRFPTNERATEIAISSKDDVYVTGWTQGILAPGVSQKQGNDKDALVLHWNDQGQVMHPKQLGTSLDDESVALVTEEMYAYVIGNSSGDLFSKKLTNPGSFYVFPAFGAQKQNDLSAGLQEKAIDITRDQEVVFVLTEQTHIQAPDKKEKKWVISYYSTQGINPYLGGIHENMPSTGDELVAIQAHTINKSPDYFLLLNTSNNYGRNFSHLHVGKDGLFRAFLI